MCIYGTLVEGSMSQHFDIGPCFYFMKCRNLLCQKMQKVTLFLT